MSIRKNISEYPSTLRGWNVNKNNLSQISGIFFILPTVVIPTLTNLEDFWYWINTLLANGDIIPLHNVKKFEPQDEEIVIGTSLQNFNYEIDKGKYKHTLSFYVDEAFHQVLQSYSGADLSVIYYANRTVILTSDDGETTFRGINVDSIITQKINFPSQGNAALSLLRIELRDNEEINLRGVFKKMNWNPQLIDSLFVQLYINATETQMIVSVTYDGSPITGLSQSDFSVNDTSHGTMTFNLFTYSGGFYTLDGFNSTLTGGILNVNSTIYIGRNAYTVIAAISYNVYDIYENGVYATYENGNYELFNN